MQRPWCSLHRWRENSSREFSGHAIQDLLKDYQKRRWEIALIGKDMSAIMDMGRRSMRQDKMRHYKQHQKREALYNLSQSVSEYYTGDDKSFTLDKKKWIMEQRRREQEERRN